MLGASKLKKDEIKQIMEAVYSEVISDQLQILKDQISSQVDEQNSENDEVQDPKIKGFLQSIDLMEDEDEEEMSKIAVEADQNKPWTLLYHALSCVEKLIEN